MTVFGGLVSIEIFLCSLTATTAHLLMSLGQTLFTGISAIVHRRRFFENHYISTTGITQEIMLFLNII